MFVSGVFLSSSAVALLARSLQRAGHRPLADDVGIAVDANWTELTLAPNEEAEILAVLDPCPALLQLLRDALQAAVSRRAVLRRAATEASRHSIKANQAAQP